MTKRTKKAGARRKDVRKEQRVAARITQQLYDVLKERAYSENKATSVVLVEALMKYLDFKMPPMHKDA